MLIQDLFNVKVGSGSRQIIQESINKKFRNSHIRKAQLWQEATRCWKSTFCPLLTAPAPFIENPYTAVSSASWLPKSTPRSPQTWYPSKPASWPALHPLLRSALALHGVILRQEMSSTRSIDPSDVHPLIREDFWFRGWSAIAHKSVKSVPVWDV